MLLSICYATESKRLEHPARKWLVLSSLLNIQEDSPFFNDGHFVDFNHFKPTFVGVIDIGAVHLRFSHADCVGGVAAEWKPVLFQLGLQCPHTAHVETKMSKSKITPNTVVKYEFSFAVFCLDQFDECLAS